LLFHRAGIQTSNRSSFPTKPATRQNAGSVTGAAFGFAFGITNGPPGCSVADVIVMNEKCAVESFSHADCA